MLNNDIWLLRTAGYEIQFAKHFFHEYSFMSFPGDLKRRTCSSKLLPMIIMTNIMLQASLFHAFTAAILI